ncbi:MAG: hypothetical protein L6Q92_00060 [Phycisphaerae bacterium]|nr:hypothetical protein [Phycisphaerae bacterium]
MIEFDFIPASFHRRMLERRRMRRFGALMAFMVLAMGGWVLAHDTLLSRYRAQLGEIQRQRNQIRVHRVSMVAMRQQRDEYKARIALTDLLNDRASAVVVLSVVAAALPAHAVLTELEWNPAAPVSPPPEVAAAAGPESPHAAGAPTALPASTEAVSGNLPSVRVSGIAADATTIGDFAAALTASPYLTDVTTQMDDESRAGPQRFEITFRVFPQTGGVR